MPKIRSATASASRARHGVFVDSGAWIALVSARDRHHAETERLLVRLIAERARLITTNLIVAEVHRFILFHVGPRAAWAVIERMESSPRLTIEFATARHHTRAREWLVKLSDQRLSYTDAISFAAMEFAACVETLSFDRDFEIAGFRLLRSP